MADWIDPRIFPLLRPNELEEMLLLGLLHRPDKYKSFYSGEHLKYLRMNDDSFQQLSDEECWSRYRFRKADIPLLIQGLQVPDTMHAENGTKFSALEGMCIVLRRLNYPKRYEDMVIEFGRHPTDIGIIFNEMLHFIHQTWDHLLTNFDQTWLHIDHLREFAHAIHNNGCPLNNCFGFIDGVLKPIARPVYNQRDVYNGKDRIHGLKYQAVTMPNGMIGNLYGPIEGRLHDSTFLRESGILDQIAPFTTENGDSLVIYGDKAYPIGNNLITPYRGVGLEHAERYFNLLMNSGRISVEWGFSKVGTLFSFTNYAPNLKLYLQPVALYYRTAAILTNCHNCLYGSQTSRYFDLEPPSLEEYLRHL